MSFISRYLFLLCKTLIISRCYSTESITLRKNTFLILLRKRYCGGARWIINGLDLFRRLEEGLAASLYLVDGPWSSSSQQTTRHRFTENEIPDCWLSGFDWLLYWLLTRSVSFYWLSLRESRVWFGCLRLSLRIPLSHDSRTLRRCIHPHHNRIPVLMKMDILWFVSVELNLNFVCSLHQSP